MTVREIPNKERNELSAQLEMLKRNNTFYIEYCKMLAKYKWEFYNECRKLGFSRWQALSLTKEFKL